MPLYIQYVIRGIGTVLYRDTLWMLWGEVESTQDSGLRSHRYFIASQSSRAEDSMNAKLPSLICCQCCCCRHRRRRRRAHECRALCISSSLFWKLHHLQCILEQSLHLLRWICCSGGRLPEFLEARSTPKRRNLKIMAHSKAGKC